MTSCPGEQALRDFLAGRVEGPWQATLSAHVETCVVCQDQLEHLTARPSLVLVEANGAASPRAASADAPGSLFTERYRLREKLGEGGMGTVWAADQLAPVRRPVAIKVIKAGLDGRDVLARFEAERQALALMDHPNIARVLDAGTVGQDSNPDAGDRDRIGILSHTASRPFFVMELVQGVPITAYCDAHKLTPRQRLELFVPVCQAIQHAHQKGIIHRDIKPSNVLVALYDDPLTLPSPLGGEGRVRGVPKVIDFGIAKATGGALTEHTLETGFGAVVGTPQYMSPEQAALDNPDIDTRSDVYSLGVLLYELLTGAPPFSGKDSAAKGLLEVLRVVREEEPPRPSARLVGDEALPRLAADRGTEPGKLTKLLRGELDWVVLKALEKDRDRRYESAGALAADVLRYLAGEPVWAYPPRASYRVRKFVRRHRVQVMAAGLVFLALVAGVIGTTVGLVRAEAARKDAVDAASREAAERYKAEGAKTEAQAREAEANALVRFFATHVFAAARPKGQKGGLGKAVTLREAIVASLPAIATEFADRPVVEARLHHELGLTFYHLGDYKRAAEQWELARTLFERQLGPDHPTTLLNLHNLANGYEAVKRPAEALKLRESVLAARRRTLPPDDPATLRSMSNLAISYAALNRPAEALKLREDVLAAQRRVLPSDHREILVSMNNLATSYHAQGRPADALKLWEEVLAAQRRVLPKDHSDTLKTLFNLSTSYAALNRLPEALKLREEALAGQRRVLPADHADTLKSLWGLAQVLVKLDRGAEAIPLIDECLAGAAGKLVHARMIQDLFEMRIQHFQKAGDPAGCRTTAALLERLNRADSASLYTAARYRGITAALQARATDAESARLAQEDADRAMAWLTRAVAAGYTNRQQLETETDLNALRGRADFQKLLAGLPKPAPSQ